WDGSIWSVVPSPNVGTHDNIFYGVAAVSSSDVWAVGSYYNGSATQTLTEHWDGTAWSVVSSPGVDTYNNLSGVAAVSSSDVWAAGYTCQDMYCLSSQTLVEQYSSPCAGSSTPTPASSVTPSLTPTRARSVTPSPTCRPSWAVVSSPNVGTQSNYLYGVAAVSTNDVWAAGSYISDSGIQTLVEHWDGSIWSVIPSANASMYDDLRGVAAVSPNDVWAVGDYDNGTVDQTLTE